MAEDQCALILTAQRRKSLRNSVANAREALEKARAGYQDALATLSIRTGATTVCSPSGAKGETMLTPLHSFQVL